MTRLASRSTLPAVFSALMGVGAATSPFSCFEAVVGVVVAGVAFAPEAIRMDMSLRFMARHIICVSNRPLAPTIPPTATSRISPTAIPAMAPATPLREFSSEMVIGISAPPTRIEKNKPKREEKNSPPMIAQKRGNPSIETEPSTTNPTVRISSKEVNIEWLGHITGL